MYPALEITDKEFLIKLDRRKFSVNLILTFLTIVEVANPTDVEERSDLKSELNKSNSAEPDYFGSLEEK